MQKRKVLLVDDSQQITEHLKGILAGIGGVGEIRIAATLPDAQRMVRDATPDIVVLDIQLPDGNGIDFLKWLKFLYPDTIVIMFSNLGDEVHRAAARNAGAQFFFDKSYEFEEVCRALNELVTAD
jgi:DNA-binding response OmpR family regulator